ncbi:terminase small subunit [Streptococcus suis]|uniref:terminase n=1 Tax=Streptococcus suis TaxID=1307 RepID=UPI000CF3EE30|nr:terminase [Streptococcus suis]HEL1630274.1 terminase [Streptococcus suis]
MAKIPDRQIEDFVAFLLAGQSQREAYRNAFKQSVRWKDETVDNKASKLWNTDEVQARYRELFLDIKTKNSKLALWSKSQAFDEFEWLKNKAKSDIEIEGVRQANSNAFLSALDGMNRMAGIGDELLDEKLRVEIETLRTKLQTEGGSDGEIIIVDKWTDD